MRVQINHCGKVWYVTRDNETVRAVAAHIGVDAKASRGCKSWLRGMWSICVVPPSIPPPPPSSSLSPSLLLFSTCRHLLSSCQSRALFSDHCYFLSHDAKTVTISLASVICSNAAAAGRSADG
jgi:hypothetical protein